MRSEINDYIQYNNLFQAAIEGMILADRHTPGPPLGSSVMLARAHAQALRKMQPPSPLETVVEILTSRQLVRRQQGAARDPSRDAAVGAVIAAINTALGRTDG